jgi:hypothetical protein
MFTLLHFLWIYKIRDESGSKIAERCLIGSIFFSVAFLGIFYLSEWIHDISTIGRGVSESYYYGQGIMQVILPIVMLFEYVAMLTFFLLRKFIVTP